MSSVDELTPRQDAVETNVEAPAIAASALGGLFLISMPAMSMRQLLAAIVLATALPLVALALLVHQQLVANERQASRASMMINARSLAALIDNEIDIHIAVAATLATSRALEIGDLVSFQRQSKLALEIIPGAWLSLSDPDGRFVMSTLLDIGQPLPPRGKLDIMAAAWATGKPQVSNVVMGPLSKRRNAFIEYPVFKAGAPLYTMVIGLNPDRFLNLMRNKSDATAVAGIVDRQQKFVARIPDHEARVGTLASEGWRAALARAPEGFAETQTLEGELSLMAYSPTRAGWTMGLAIPMTVLEAPVRRILWTTGLIGSVLALLGLTLALGLGRRLSRTVTQLETAARMMGRGAIVPPEAFPIAEATSISQALSTSSRELARRETALRESELFSRTVLEANPDCVKVGDFSGRLEFVNQSAVCLLELASCDVLIGQKWETLWPHSQAQRIRDAIAAAQSGRESRFSAASLTAKGAEKIWDVVVSPVLDLRGRPIKFLASSRDITGRTIAEKTLRDSEARFRGTFETTAVGIAHVGLDATFHAVNQRLCEMLGYSRDELLAKTFQGITFTDDIAAYLENERKLLAGEVSAYTMDTRYIRNDGTIIWIGLTVALQCDAFGAPQYFIAMMRDIAARKDAQDHQRFLLRELAHRSKNQLSIIQSMANQTARSAATLAEFRTNFSDRLRSLAASTDLLVDQNWTSVSLADLVHSQLAPFTGVERRLICEGPRVSLTANAAQAIGLALHELATNCVKYGAWSSPAGTLTVRWTLDRNGAAETSLRLSWCERGGPAVTPPTRKGFGHIVVEDMVAQKLDGQVEMAFDPQGLGWTLTIPEASYRADAIRRGRDGL